jgi:acyl-CoA dehydrogenase
MLQAPFFDEGHEALHRELNAWIHAQLGDIREDRDARKTCEDVVQQLASGGWLDYCVPKSSGGRFDTLDVRSLCLIRETLAFHHGLADFAFAMQGLGSGPISLFGSDALKGDYLSPTREGKKIAAFALSEPEAGSDVGAITTMAHEDGDSYVLDGEKTWISNGGLADYYVVFAKTVDEKLSALVVDQDAPGLRIAETIDVVSPHPLARLSFENCRVPKTHLVGTKGKGLKVALATLDIFRSTVGAAAVGFAQRALHEALNEVDSRVQFGKKLSEFQLTQARLADMATAIDAAALLVYRAAWKKDQGAERVGKESSMAKMFATEAAQKVVDDAVQLCGARGVVKGSVPERLYREVRALRIYEGTTEIHKLIIARHLIEERGHDG